MIDSKKYQELYKQSIENPETFWAERAKRIDWIAPFTNVKDCLFSGDVHIRWYENGKLNVSANCIDRHLKTRADQTAILWEPNDPKQTPRKVTYLELYESVCKFSNLLKTQGVKKGDRVTIYMPMIPEAAFAMLACTRIGAVHSVVFGGFSPEALAGRILDCGSVYLITVDQGYRADKTIELKKNADQALLQCPNVKKVFVVRHTGADVPWRRGGTNGFMREFRK